MSSTSRDPPASSTPSESTRTRQIIVTADGVMEGPGGEPGYRNSGWTFKDVPFDPAAFEIKGREQEEAGGLLLGRTSYEAFAPVWPTMDDFARYNELPRWVVSSTLRQDDDRWPATILRSTDEVARLKEEDGGAPPGEGRTHLFPLPMYSAHEGLMRC